SPSSVPSSISLLLTLTILHSGVPQFSVLTVVTVTDFILWLGGHKDDGLAVTLVMVGAMLSTTVTVAVALASFPFTSFTVNVTVFAPTFAQVKLVIFSVLSAMPQLSDEPLSTCVTVTLALPSASR